MTEIVLHPSTAQEVALALSDAARGRTPVELIGAGTKRGMAGASPEGAVEIRLNGLNRVLEYEPRDLTISVEAGMPYAALTELLAERGQMLPLDPPWAAAATIGGVVATNSSGPRRRAHGAARDLVIGMSLATADGRVVETGGMVVKNVAGLDVQKLLIGSYGTLAAVTSVNFKLAPLPEATRTFVQRFQTAEKASAARNKVLQGVLQPVAIEVLNPAAAELCGLDEYCLVLQAAGAESVLKRYAAEMPDAAACDGSAEVALWNAVREFVPRFISLEPKGAVVRVLHPLQDLRSLLEHAPGACLDRAGNGVAWVLFWHAAEVAKFLEATEGKGWSRTVEYAPAEWRAKLDSWPDAGDDLELMRQLKAMLDPYGVLNPGRLYGRL